MVNTYHSIASQILKLENAKRSSFFKEFHFNDTKFENEHFLTAYELLSKRFYAIHSLFGEKNFKEIIYIFLKTNPLHSHKEQCYGDNFASFLGSLEQVKDFYFVRFIAMLDWFWFSAKSPRERIQLPKGTLKSWGTIIRGEELVEIEMDEVELETLSIEKNGKEFRIIEH